MKRFVTPVKQTVNWALLGGLIVTLPVLTAQHWHEMNKVDVADWIESNLGFSIVAFMLVVILFGFYLMKENEALAMEDINESEVQHLDSITDIMVSLSFGVGVIWTAIGMRNALVNGLTGVGANMAESGNAFAILERLVDGGILVALSTTIVGGILGYLLRVIKNIVVGRKLNDFYQKLDNRYIMQLSKDVAGIQRYLAREV